MRDNPTRDLFVAVLSGDDPVIDEDFAEDLYEELRKQELRGRRERVISLDRYCERQLKAKNGTAGR